MYEQMFDNLRKATESAIQVQQEMVRTWANFWPGMASQLALPAQVQAFQQKWADIYGELVRKQHESLDAQFNAGMKVIEETFRIPTARDPMELRTRLMDSWQKSFDCLRQVAEGQMKTFQAVVAKSADLIAKPGG